MALLARVTAPTGALLSIADLRRDHLRIDAADEDGALDEMIEAATDWLDGPRGALGRCLLTQTWRVSVAGPVDGRVALPLAPVVALTGASYLDASGAEQSITLADLVLVGDGDRAHVEPAIGKAWPVTAQREDALRLTVSCGYGAEASAVPAGIRHAARLLVAHWYANREPSSDRQSHEIPYAVEALVNLHRVGWVRA